MSDRQEMTLTFETQDDARRATIRYWRENKGDSNLKLTVVELED